MLYKLKFGSGGKVESWKECPNPSSGQWRPSTREIGWIGKSGNTSWRVGSQHLIIEAHHLSDIIKGLKKEFAQTKFILPSKEGVVHIKHQYWESPRRQHTLNFQNITRPGYRAMAEKAQHRHRIVLGTGSISHGGDWTVNCFGLMEITGEQLAIAIEAHKSKIKKSGSVVQDAIEEAIGWVPMIGGIFGV